MDGSRLIDRDGDIENNRRELKSLEDYLFHPTPPVTVYSVQGDWSTYKADLEIELSNGHFIRYEYKGTVDPTKESKISIILCTNTNEINIYDLENDIPFMDIVSSYGSVLLGIMKLYEDYYLKLKKY